MPRKELSPPSENRKKAMRLFDADEQSEGDFVPLEQTYDEPYDEPDGSFEENDGLRVRSKSEKNRKSARQYAMSLVAMKAYTERSLREKLRNRGYGCDETDDAVEYLKGFGYINDLRLAQNAAEKLAEKLNGRRKIFAYLASKGISRETIESLDLSEIDFKENCRALALRLSAMGKPSEKIAAALSRAGFSSSEIYFALDGIE